MRKSLWIMLAVMVVAVGAPNAHGDSFTATFECTACLGGTPTAPDVSFPAPVLDVTWNGLLFSLTLSSDDQPTDSYSWEGFTVSDPSCGPTSICSQNFEIVDMDGGGGSTISQLITGLGMNVSAAPDHGALVFTPAVTAPEPSSVALLLLGVGLVFVLRKRNSRGHQLAM